MWNVKVFKESTSLREPERCSFYIIIQSFKIRYWPQIFGNMQIWQNPLNYMSGSKTAKVKHMLVEGLCFLRMKHIFPYLDMIFKTDLYNIVSCIVSVCNTWECWFLMVP